MSFPCSPCFFSLYCSFPTASVSNLPITPVYHSAAVREELWGHCSSTRAWLCSSRPSRRAVNFHRRLCSAQRTGGGLKGEARAATSLPEGLLIASRGTERRNTLHRSSRFLCPKVTTADDTMQDLELAPQWYSNCTGYQNPCERSPEKRYRFIPLLWMEMWDVLGNH